MGSSTTISSTTLTFTSTTSNTKTSIVYEPCAPSAEGSPCLLCAPWDTRCIETRELKTCQGGECRGRVFQYELLSRGSCTNPIVDIEECAVAAVSLGLSDTIATDDGQYSEWYSAWWDPPYCYFELGS